MRAYRFLEPQWADALCDAGSIRVNSLEYFRRMEGAQRDEYDSATHYESGEMFLSKSDAHPAEIEALKRGGIFIGPGATNVRIADNRATYVMPGAALCFCRTADGQAFLPSGKTALVEISDLDSFAAAVTNAAGGRLGDRFVVGPVEYVSDIVAKGTQIRPDPSPFRKRDSYRLEDECRIYWPNAYDGPLDIQHDDLRRLATRLI